MIAQGLPTIDCRSESELLDAVRQLIADYGITEIVMGLPVSLSGRPSARSEKVRAFAGRLVRDSGIPVTLVDERLTTVMATRVLAEMNKRPGQGRKQPWASRRRRAETDRIAAMIILEGYLARERIR